MDCRTYLGNRLDDRYRMYVRIGYRCVPAVRNNNMNTYWAFVSIDQGAFIRVTVQAPTPYIAEQMLKAMYGDKLKTHANPV